MTSLPPEQSGTIRRLTRIALAGVTTFAVLAGLPGTAAAAPPSPPPPDPGASQLDAAAIDAQQKADAVVALTARFTSAQAQLSELHQQLELTKELANKALVDQSAAQDAVAAADVAQTAARAAVSDANVAVTDANQQATRFAVSSFEEGTTIGPLSAYLASSSPQDLLDRAALLNAVGGSKLDVMKAMEQAQTRSVAATTQAQATKEKTAAAGAQAARAKQAADDATQGAMRAQQNQLARAQELATQANRAKYDLDNAEQNAAGLQGQRLAFDQWLAQRRASAAAADKAAAGQARAQFSALGSTLGTVSATPAAQAVIRRAASQLGVPYAWGGGDSRGPTQGVRDGGVADSYGDFAKVGFDCSGLMMYAFGGAGVSLPHYTGYQYQAGKQVPLSDLQPGDMVFYSPGGIHHVALYIGAGQMIEAPSSGSYVTVSAVRSDGIMPFAVRMV